jgi:hypothetical protein
VGFVAPLLVLVLCCWCCCCRSMAQCIIATTSLCVYHCQAHLVGFVAPLLVLPIAALLVLLCFNRQG